MTYLKANQTAKKPKNKICLSCKKTGTFAPHSRTCEHCKQIKAMEKTQQKQLKTIEKLDRKKAKVITILKLSDLKKVVQRKVNKYIRERDKEQGCISCGNQNASSYEAGHFIAQGSSGFLRYDLDNIHKQCYSCNHFKHANLLEYRIALIRKIGVERVEYLEAHRHDTHSWTREELTEVVTALSSMEVKGKVV